MSPERDRCSFYDCLKALWISLPVCRRGVPPIEADPIGEGDGLTIDSLGDEHLIGSPEHRELDPFSDCAHGICFAPACASAPRARDEDRKRSIPVDPIAVCVDPEAIGGVALCDPLTGIFAAVLLGAVEVIEAREAPLKATAPIEAGCGAVREGAADPTRAAVVEIYTEIKALIAATIAVVVFSVTALNASIAL